MSDLTAEEQAAYRHRPKIRIETSQRQVEQQFVRVPGPDYDAEGFRQAIAREAQTNPHHAEVLHRIREGAQMVAEGLRSKERMFGGGPPPTEIITQ